MPLAGIADFERRICRITAADPRLHHPSTVYCVGLALRDARRELPFESFERLLDRLSFLRSTATGERALDKHLRIMAVANIRCIASGLDQLPRGWATLRLLPSLVRNGDERPLAAALASGLINSRTTRDELKMLAAFLSGRGGVLEPAPAASAPSNVRRRERDHARNRADVSASATN